MESMEGEKKKIEGSFVEKLPFFGLKGGESKEEVCGER
jgi:hypothetical protein